jgi:thiamine biosynthesis lipoprotein
LGGDDSPCRYWLKNASLSGSGLAVKGNHIVDSRTGQPAGRRSRAWALCHTGAESDALSTACMVLPTNEIIAVLDAEQSWLVFLEDNGHPWPLGQRTLPAMA